jgi:hypothetical protein
MLVIFDDDRAWRVGQGADRALPIARPKPHGDEGEAKGRSKADTAEPLRPSDGERADASDEPTQA